MPGERRVPALWAAPHRGLAERDVLLGYALETARDFDGDSALDRALHHDLTVLLPFGYNPKVDVATMMSSLEARCPFQDREVVEWAATVPASAKLERWEQNIIHVGKKNPLYWRGWPANKFTTINLRHIYEPETQRLMIEKGELDWAENITKDALPALKRNPALTVYEKPGTSLMVTYINTQTPPTKDLRVRQAIHHMWNQEAFGAITGHAPNPGPLFTPLLGKDWRMENPYPYNPDRAKKLLAEAGYPNGGFTLRFQSQKGDVDKRAIFEEIVDRTFAPPLSRQLSFSQVSTPNSPSRGTGSKRQRSFPVRASKARTMPDGWMRRTTSA